MARSKVTARIPGASHMGLPGRSRLDTSLDQEQPPAPPLHADLRHQADDSVFQKAPFLLVEPQRDFHGQDPCPKFFAQLQGPNDDLSSELPTKRRKLDGERDRKDSNLEKALSPAAILSHRPPHFSPSSAQHVSYIRMVKPTSPYWTPDRPAPSDTVIIKVSPALKRNSNDPDDFSCRMVQDHRHYEDLFDACNIPTLAEFQSKSQVKLSNALWKHTTITQDSHNEGLFKLEIRVFSHAGIAWRSALPIAGTYSNFVAKYATFKQDRVHVDGDHTNGDWRAPQAFYDCAHLPDSNKNVLPSIQPNALQTELYPFQKQATAWLLAREGFSLDASGDLKPIDQDELCPSFHSSRDLDGNKVYTSPLLNGIMTESHRADWNRTKLRGGILAEEMGLGKTVELIALICLHKRTSHVGEEITDAFSNSKVTGSKTTLIITPPSILKQWTGELATHAPSLKVHHYQGVKDEDKDVNLLDYDVVLTTYQVLSKEIHYAGPKVEKGLRHAKRYEVRRSPLVQISWWRVCLDEAQMIEGGVSNAATVARQIPRCNSWAVSGTPFKRDVDDLQGLLSFLRYDPFCHHAVWKLILQSYRHVFEQIFSTIALRHTKESVRSELGLPPQKRVVITVPFAAIEEQNYTHLFQQMCEDCGLDRDGAPLSEDWDPENDRTVERMRQWLARLRQTCLHPEIGGRNRKALGRGEGPLRTLDEVLDVMIEQNEAQLRVEERTMLIAKTKQAHIYSFAKQPQMSLKIYLECLERATAIVRECREILETERAKVKAEELKRENELASTEEDSDIEVETEEKNSRLTTLSLRLRSALELQHICTFFLATTYFQVKSDTSLTQQDSPDFHELEKKESETYDEAKAIRTELLTEVSSRTRALMLKVETSKNKMFVTVPKITPFSNNRGIESRQIQVNVRLLREILNKQADQLDEWRRELTDRLLMSLLDQDDTELTGEEYEQTTIRQDEQYAYLDALRALIADRNTMLTGQPNVLVNYEMREALRLAKDGKGPAPELMQSCLATRSKLRVEESMSIRGVIGEVRGLITSARWQAGSDGRGRGMAEAHILEQELENLQTIQKQQTKSIGRLEKELDLFRTTMNARLDFYRQVQEISDTVAPLQEEASDEIDRIALGREVASEQKHREKLASHTTKRRFLQHLKADSTGQAERICIICQDPFEVGVLTVCGHQFCKECINLWYNQHRSCPVCKRRLTERDFHEVMYKPRELMANVETSPNRRNSSYTGADQSPSKPIGSIYSEVSSSTLNAIKSVDIPGSFGTKIDTIARHLLYLRESDPGAKAIIFSQYRDFLNVLGTAFSRFKIGYADIAHKNGITKFKEDPSAECFLLHAKADSSGLNLVNATHVFLCEPLINAALELQAIARVHRIGQRRPTTVWMYLVRDTVEEAIYDISVRRRLEHVKTTRSHSSPKSKGKKNMVPDETTREEDLDTANSGLLQQAPNVAKLMAKGASGGELVDKDDLWQCLFGSRTGGRREADVSQLLSDANGEQTLAGRELGKHLRAEAAESRARQQ
ncbi:hypothetical protein FH972_020973 [Carpinus fangiana]|uniref:RING-type domain-containing protein n=1 Tax=Carpinus fangiana TaxID=176857 RepID=A0A5N6KMZ6_9ROSI|nr:hypothetical protein FH972_020973 [Carpinus fangiana]